MFCNGPNNIRDNKEPDNPRALNNHYIMTWYYMLRYGFSCRFHSQFVQPNGNGKAGNWKTLFSHMPATFTVSYKTLTRAALGLLFLMVMSAGFPPPLPWDGDAFESFDADSWGLTGKSTRSSQRWTQSFFSGFVTVSLLQFQRMEKTGPFLYFICLSGTLINRCFITIYNRTLECFNVESFG